MADYAGRIPPLARDGDYLSWASQMRAFLITQDRLDMFLDATPPVSDTANRGKDLLCKARLQLHVAGPLQAIVSRAQTAKEAWEALYVDYQGSLRTQQPQLTAKLTELSQGNDSIATYIDNLLALRDRFEALNMKEALPLLSSQFIRGLRDEIRLACAASLHKVMEKKNATIDDLARELKSLALLLPDSVTSGRLAGRANTATGLMGKREQGRAETRTCHYCGKVGHLIRDCRKKKRDEGGNQRTHPQQKRVSFRLPNEERGRKGSTDNQGTIMTLSTPTINSTHGRANRIWLDSGATHHVVCAETLLTNIRPTTVPMVVLGGGEEHKVISMGDLVLTNGHRGPVTLTGALCVPTLGVNLVSTPQITAKKGSCWEGEHQAKVFDPQGRLILLGSKVDGMYQLECTLPYMRNASVNSTDATDAHVWHQRFGHIGREAMRKLSAGGVVKGMPKLQKSHPTPCDVCDMAKQPRTSFPRSDSRAAEQLQVVHCDTMGPFPVRGLKDEAYVVTALDDFSGFAETILIRNKSEAASGLVNLLTRWETQTEKRVKVVRTDQGTEYKGDLAAFCKRKGVVHQVSVVYTPEQNGRAERLNRTLLERTRALMLQHRMPDSVWSEAMPTAAYLRNLTPQAEKRLTPYELFYGKKPDVSHLRVYGCKVAVHVRHDARTKLDPVSEECAMVGYAHSSKAYRLMKLGHNRDLTIIEAISAKFYETERPSFLEGYVDEDAKALAPYSGGIGLPVGVADESFTNTDSTDTSSEGDDENGPHENDSQGGAGGTEDAEHVEEASVAGSNAMGGDMQVPEPEVPVVPDIADAAEAMDANDEPHRRYPKRVRHPPTMWYQAQRARINAAKGLTDSPQSFKEVQARPDYELFKEALDIEMAALWEKGVYEECSLPHVLRLYLRRLCGRSSETSLDILTSTSVVLWPRVTSRSQERIMTRCLLPQRNKRPFASWLRWQQLKV